MHGSIGSKSKRLRRIRHETMSIFVVFNLSCSPGNEVERGDSRYRMPGSSGLVCNLSICIDENRAKIIKTRPGFDRKGSIASDRKTK